MHVLPLPLTLLDTNRSVLGKQIIRINQYKIKDSKKHFKLSHRFVFKWPRLSPRRHQLR